MAVSTPPSKYRSYYGNFFRAFPNYSIRLTRHARDRMNVRNIQLPQIRAVLKTGALVHVESDIRTGMDKYRVAGRDSDGRRLEVVAGLDETGSGRITIITVIDTTDAGGGGRSKRRGTEDRATETDDGSVSEPP